MLERYDPTKEFTFSANYDVAPPVVWATPLEQLSVTIKCVSPVATSWDVCGVVIPLTFSWC